MILINPVQNIRLNLKSEATDYIGWLSQVSPTKNAFLEDEMSYSLIIKTGQIYATCSTSALCVQYSVLFKYQEIDLIYIVFQI